VNRFFESEPVKGSRRVKPRLKGKLKVLKSVTLNSKKTAKCSIKHETNCIYNF